MYKSVVFALLIAFGSPVLAGECRPEPELDEGIIKADEDGEARMRALLEELEEKKGLTKEQAVDFYLSVLEREKIRTAQRMRDQMTMYLLDQIRTGDCRKITSAKQSARAAIIVQWQWVNEEIEREIASSP